ncbi:hypothetical protein As57867_005137, partial [Aphanomyces stellatus]
MQRNARALDGNLDVFYGRGVFVCLNAELVSNFISSALYLLQSSLSNATVTTVRTQLMNRTITPFLETLAGTRKPFWWQTQASNWNAVCWNGMTTAVLATVPNVTQRASVIVSATTQTLNYLKSFTDDGYGLEGVGYFNYGFGDFTELREKLCEATQGNVDLFASSTVDAVAQFSLYFPMRQPNTAAFGDDHLGTAFSTSIANYVQWAYGSNTLLGGTLVSNSLPSVLMMLTSNVPNLPRACAALARPTAVASDPLRHIFNISQVAVLHASNQSLFDMTFKVTGNGGHSHNDMGSYEILVNNTFVLGDAGGPLYYEARTFDSRRYLSPLMNSFGHPVPVVAGMNQSEAVSVQASHKFQLNATLSPMVDTLTTDLAAAYAVPTLESLVRQVTFDRTGLGKITIQDTVTMKAGAVVDFESAFTALG